MANKYNGIPSVMSSNHVFLLFKVILQFKRPQLQSPFFVIFPTNLANFEHDLGRF